MNNATQLYRQVNPVFIQEGRVTSQVFSPTPKDEKRLSVYDGDQITPEAAWKHFTETLNFNSVGVLAVTVQDCKQQNLSVAADSEPFPEHVLIDFRAVPSGGEMRKKAKILTKTAVDRGWLFQP